MADDSQPPSEEDLREALDAIGVSDILLNALSVVASIGFRRLSAEERDLNEVRLAIETLRALDPVLRDAGVDEAVVRDLEQARANLQLAYASAVAEATEPTEPAEAAPADVPEEDPAEAQSAVGEEPAL